MVAFFVAPFMTVVVASFLTASGQFSLHNYARALGDLYYWRTLFLTFRLSLWVTVAALIISYPLAYFMTKVVHSRSVRRLIYAIVVTPLFTSNIVRSFGWMVLLSRHGLVNQVLIGSGLTERPLALMYTELSIIIGLTYISAPFMVLTIASVLQNVPPRLLEAARDLGAGRIGAFLRVTLPLSLPGVIAGSVIVFTLSVSAYVTPSIMSGGKTMVMPMLIFQQYSVVFDMNFGAALAVVLLLSTLLLVALYLLAIERGPRRRMVAA